MSKAMNNESEYDPQHERLGPPRIRGSSRSGSKPARPANPSHRPAVWWSAPVADGRAVRGLGAVAGYGEQGPNHSTRPGVTGNAEAADTRRPGHR